MFLFLGGELEGVVDGLGGFDLVEVGLVNAAGLVGLDEAGSCPAGPGGVGCFLAGEGTDVGDLWGLGAVAELGDKGANAVEGAGLVAGLVGHVFYCA